MRIFVTAGALLASLCLAAASPVLEKDDTVIVEEVVYDCPKIKPKIFIISMFLFEADIWYANDKSPGSIGDLLAQNITVPGFSPLYPNAHCLADGSVCQLTTGESEINAATTIASLVASPQFDLTTTYFMIAGIAGINPKYGTLGDVAFCKYAVQVALQYEFDAREIPANFSAGYVPQGSVSPDEYPQSIYGTEVFEVNEHLRDIAASLASTALPFNDSEAAVAYRANYASGGGIYTQATRAPNIIKCDVATSDVYYSGVLLGEAFENTTKLFTNGSGVYCMTAQEDNATLEALIRGAINGLIDFSRIIIMRTASDFDRPYPGESDLDNLFYIDQGGFEPALQNIYIAGLPIVKAVLADWTTGRNFSHGFKPGNYIGDIFGSLGGAPDFGPGSISGDMPVNLSTVGISKRAMSRADLYKREVRVDEYGRERILGRRDGKGMLGAEVARRAQGYAEAMAE